MNFKHTKLKSVAVAALLGSVFVPSLANAAVVTPTVASNITTSSAITVADGVDQTWGTWFLIFRNADVFSLHMTTAGVITTVGLGATPATDSRALNIVSAPQAGTVTVMLPSGVNGVVLNMQRTAIVDFVDIGLTLSNITYATATEGANIALPATTNVPVTALVGGTPETVSFGADIDITGTPADATHSASFVVSFAY